jgi:hypothetical protein
MIYILRKWLWLGAVLWKKGRHLAWHRRRNVHIYFKVLSFPLSISCIFLPLTRSKWSSMLYCFSPSIALQPAYRQECIVRCLFLAAKRDYLAYYQKIFSKRKKSWEVFILFSQSTYLWPIQIIYYIITYYFTILHILAMYI